MYLNPVKGLNCDFFIGSCHLKDILDLHLNMYWKQFLFINLQVSLLYIVSTGWSNPNWKKFFIKWSDWKWNFWNPQWEWNCSYIFTTLCFPVNSNIECFSKWNLLRSLWVNHNRRSNRYCRNTGTWSCRRVRTTDDFRTTGASEDLVAKGE